MYYTAMTMRSSYIIFSHGNIGNTYNIDSSDNIENTMIK